MTLSPLPSATTDPAATPETTALLLATFADLYRQEVGREEDVNRSLPFFGTALGIVIAAVAYAAGRLPKWPDLTTAHAAGSVSRWQEAMADLHTALFYGGYAMLALAVVQSACVLFFVARATAHRDSRRIGPETVLLSRLGDLQSFHRTQGTATLAQDALLAAEMRQMLIDSYAAVTPFNREINLQRNLARAKASAHLILGLTWALVATTLIFVADKLGDLPKVTP